MGSVSSKEILYELQALLTYNFLKIDIISSSFQTPIIQFVDQVGLKKLSKFCPDYWARLKKKKKIQCKF